MITSPRNPRLQFIRNLLAHSKERRAAQAFVIEGVRLAEEALQAGWPAQWVVYTPELSPRGRSVVEAFAGRGVMVEEASPAALSSISDTETPQGLLVVLTATPLPLPPQPDFVLIADAIRDPGNLGTILRTASAAGVQAVLLPPGGVDAFSPKVLRAAMGAHFRLPVQVLDWSAMRAYLQPPAVSIYLAEAHGETLYTQADFQRPLALIIGGEADGAGRQAQALAERRLRIPMPGGAESLNAAVAAAVLMFEVVRQRTMAVQGSKDER